MNYTLKSRVCDLIKKGGIMFTDALSLVDSMCESLLASHSQIKVANKLICKTRENIISLHRNVQKVNADARKKVDLASE